MRDWWVDLGRLAFWLSWPLLYFYLRGSERTRLLLIAEGKVLVMRGWLSSGQWALPGGGLHRRESPLAGVLRELYEETGIRLKPQLVKETGAGVAAENGLSFRYRQFFARLPEAVPVRRQPFEVVDVAWIPLSEVTAENAGQLTFEMVSGWKGKD